jgi:hypothetical protein
MIRLEELKAYQRTRIAASDLAAEDRAWPGPPPASAELRPGTDGEASGAAEAA